MPMQILWKIKWKYDVCKWQCATTPCFSVIYLWRCSPKCTTSYMLHPSHSPAEGVWLICYTYSLRDAWIFHNPNDFRDATLKAAPAQWKLFQNHCLGVSPPIKSTPQRWHCVHREDLNFQHLELERSFVLSTGWGSSVVAEPELVSTA